MQLAKNKRNAIAVVVMALVLTILYLVIRVILMVVSLQSTVNEVDQLQKIASTKDLAQISAGLGKAADAIAMADASAKDPLVQLAGYLPVIGADIKAASIVASDGRLVLQGAQDVSNIANQLIKAGIGSKPLTDSTLVSSMRESMSAMNEAVQKLNRDLAGVDAGSLHFGLDQRIGSAKQIVSSLANASARITPIVQVGTVVLEQPDTKRWFVAIQNLSELRGTGGITGAYAILTAKNGKVKLDEYGSDKTLLKMGGINYKNYPEELRDIWGVDLADWRDINASAHAPYAARLMADGWQQKRGQKIDGVLFVGQGVVSELSGAVGAITVRGVSVEPSNVIDFLSKDIYAKFTNVQVKDAVVGELAKEMFSRLVSGKVSASGFLKSAAEDTTGDRMMAWAEDKNIQKLFSNYRVSGEVSEKFGPNVLVTVNNAGGNKLDAYTFVKLDYVLGICNVDTFTGYQGRKSRVTVEIENRAPKSGLPAYVDLRLDDQFGEARPKGSNRDLVTIYGPVGSESETITVNGEDEFVSIGTDRNRPIWVFEVTLLAGEKKTLVIDMVEPINDDNQELISGAPSLIPPVMLNSPSVSVSSIGECRLQ